MASPWWSLLPLAVLAREGLAEPHPVPSLTVQCRDTELGHWQCGEAIGKHFKDRIQETFATDALLQTLMRKVQDTDQGKSVFEAFVSHAKQRYPLYVAELNGTAVGSGVALDFVLVANLRQELGTALAETKPPTPAGMQTPDACSDVLLADRSRGESGWAHNEDFDIDYFDSIYFVRQSILNADGQETYSFASFTYPGVLPGWAPGWNSYGLGMSWNVLYPSAMPAGPSVGVAFVCRDALSAKSIEEAIELATPTDLALGQNLNVGSFHSKRMVTVEIAPGGKNDVMDIVDEVTFHANEYLRMQLPQAVSHLTSSRHRKRVFDSLTKSKKLHSMQDLLWVLGDTSDAAYPIFRRNDTTREDTLFTIAFDLKERTITTYRDNPRLGNASELWVEHVSLDDEVLLV